MHIPDIGRLVSLGKAVVMANRPEILLGTAIASTLGSVVLAAKGGYESGKQVLMEDIDRESRGDLPLSLQEKTLLTWQNYIPAAGAYIAGVGSTVGLHWIHVKEKRAIVATGLAAVEEVRANSQTYINDIKESVEKNSTPKTRDKIIEDVNLVTADRNGGILREWSDGVITEMYLVRDAKSGRDIWSNQAMIDQAVNELNAHIIHEGEASLNTFYEAAGFPRNDDGEDFGWNGGVELALQWTNSSRSDGRPVREFKFRDEPEKNFDRASR